MLSRLSIAALWSPAGKGLTSWLLYVMNIVIIWLLGKVWYLIVSIPDPCCLSYFEWFNFISLIIVRKKQHEVSHNEKKIYNKDVK